MPWLNSACPYLPPVDRAYTPDDLKPFGKDRGPGFYTTALHYAQSYWQLGFPAKSILLCNRALSSPMDGDEPIFTDHPLPYQALAWILIQRPERQFIGNPRRHWQHLATRMVEPHKELRTWRAWACWYLAKTILPESEFPSDMVQIRNEQIIEPTFDQIFENLGRLSPAEDLATWQHALHWARNEVAHPAPPPNTVSRIRIIRPVELPTVIALGHEIWNQHYPGIISQQQIDYMLTVWYQVDAMTREIEQRGVVYALIECEGEGAIGYLGLERQPGSDVLFISKLYLKRSHHGRGLGQQSLEWIRHHAAAQSCHTLRLRVNKANTTAIRSYLRAGFQIVEDICSDIGNGFVMDDYLLERTAAA